MNNRKTTIITISIIALVIAGIVNYVNYLINKPLKILNNYTIPAEFIYNGAKIALAWTDDNTGENLIIQSDKKEYSGFNTADVYFSITNISNKDQDVVINFIPKEGGKIDFINLARINEAELNKSYKSYQSLPSNIIKSGETNFYKATLKFKPLGRGEFNIEAIGTPTNKLAGINMINKNIAYGLLDPWYSSSWSYKRAITLQGSKIATTTTGFPILATTTLADLKTTANGGKVGNDDGYDIIFVDSDDSTLLNYEREKYASTTGEIAYWIKTDIASSTDKTIYMYYGNAGASDTATTTGVWDDNFVGVWHLPDQTTASGTDSTLFANNGNVANGASTTASAQIDGGMQFDGVDDYVSTGSGSSLDNLGPLTWAAWMYPRSVGEGSAGRVFDKAQKRLFLENDTSRNIAFGVSGVSLMYRYTANNVFNLNAWSYVTVTWDGTNDQTKIHIYVNGIECSYSGGANGSTPNDDSASDFVIGNVIGTTATFNGLIDEARVSNTIRTQGWITTEYNNQSDVGSFMTIGAEEWGELNITTTPKVIKTGVESTAFTVQIPHNAVSDVTVNLSSDSSGTHYFASTTAGEAVTTVTIPSGADSVNFYYTDYQPGAPTITVAADNFTSDTQQQMVQGVWQNTSYQCRRQITLQGSKIATTTAGFPILATTTLADLKTTTNGGKVGNDNGYDIIFVDSDDSTLLNYERELYASTTGEIAYWIKTDIASSTDKTIYMYYGNAGASDTATTTGVWDDNFVMVNHLAHNGVATTTYPDFLDSTLYNNDGSSVNMNSADLVNGQVDGALDFDGTDDYVNLGESQWDTFHATSTFAAWIYPTVNNEFGIVSKGIGATAGFKFYQNWQSLAFQLNSQATVSNVVFSTLNKWYYVAAVLDNKNIKLYVNGAYNVNTGGTFSASSNNNYDCVIGAYKTASVSNYFPGLIDEVRVSNTARTAGWITTEYNNQSSVGSFMAIGAEECLPVPAERSGGGENVKTMIKGGVRFKGGTRF